MTESNAELLPATRRALDHRLALAQSEGRVPSAVAAVAREGRVVWSGGRGELPAGARPEEVQYRIGSLTKTMTAVLVMRLRDEGRVDLADPLGAHLDVPHGGEATLFQLLSHTGGLAAEARGPWWERTPGELRPELPDIFGEQPQKHHPGRRYHYSNPGYALLGALVERLRGEPWFTVLRREVLEPLGMRRTTALPAAPHAEGWAVHPYADVRQREPLVDTGRMAPAGQLWSTAADLALFAAFLADADDAAGTGARSGAHEAILGAATRAEMRRPAAPPEAGAWDSSYGLGVQLARRPDGRVLAGHGGSMPGFVANLWTSGADRLAAVALANATSGLGGVPAAELLELVAAHEPAPPEPWRPMPADDADPALLALAGAWYWGTVPYLLRVHAGRMLTLTPAAGAGVRASRFLPCAAGGWRGLDGYFAGEALRAVTAGEGRVTHLDLGTYVFTREPYDPAAPLPGGADPEGWR
ncbi:serine hydrolase domain-containing protein [Streptomyces hoynatensis]|uniref:Class A beta-lactamase-related serine hydrolase n=1 Tax=Streptomyces hoynatensis TaxID=1141874 RepID=A0A3A9Z597_9ACTN|nr:serine hydrolase domain-containing protein [Streptomyces hoynatensis]RKN43189.1 class A beta-lactamase-related serine hydrolase [Streptomyces hoynatensis]